jgi:protein-S-isoprenylcysteine O-methyltransferase Ste14
MAILWLRMLKYFLKIIDIFIIAQLSSWISLKNESGKPPMYYTVVLIQMLLCFCFVSPAEMLLWFIFRNRTIEIMYFVICFCIVFDIEFYLYNKSAVPISFLSSLQRSRSLITGQMILLYCISIANGVVLLLLFFRHLLYRC